MLARVVGVCFFYVCVGLGVEGVRGLEISVCGLSRFVSGLFYFGFWEVRFRFYVYRFFVFGFLNV